MKPLSLLVAMLKLILFVFNKIQMSKHRKALIFWYQLLYMSETAIEQQRVPKTNNKKGIFKDQIFDMLQMLISIQNRLKQLIALDTMLNLQYKICNLCKNITVKTQKQICIIIRMNNCPNILIEFGKHLMVLHVQFIHSVRYFKQWMKNQTIYCLLAGQFYVEIALLIDNQYCDIAIITRECVVQIMYHGKQTAKQFQIQNSIEEIVLIVNKQGNHVSIQQVCKSTKNQNTFDIFKMYQNNYNHLIIIKTNQR
ncbi:unnamed protein product [Paramecium octaurelia]|uniref:Transmembrane protein n=1 Tax=Paramecium octaurelia TaxID=43137 RepID=A0A8S1SDK1_PAROT|nr:unnamed protein product [Paramecium octaurelia]